MTIGASSASAQPDPSVLVELLARRWREGRPYFTLRERIEGAGLQAWWQRRPGHRGLGLYWARSSPRNGATGS